MKYVVRYTYENKTYTALETERKVFAQKLHNQIHNLHYPVETNVYDANGNLVKVIKYN